MKIKRNIVAENQVAKVFTAQGGPESAIPQVFMGYDDDGTENLHIFLSREQWTPTDERWHISIKARDRVPTWDEIAEACHTVRPGVPFVMGVPPRSMWMNVHENVLHMWESKDEGLLQQWKYEGEAARAIGKNRRS